MKVEIKKVQDHYEIWVDGKFHCSCDNLREVKEEARELEDDELWER